MIEEIVISKSEAPDLEPFELELEDDLEHVLIVGDKGELLALLVLERIVDEPAYREYEAKGPVNKEGIWSRSVAVIDDFKGNLISMELPHKQGFLPLDVSPGDSIELYNITVYP